MTGLLGRRVLVTGADGFIGSHLVQRLLVEQAEVRAFCMYNPTGSWGSLDELGKDERAALDVRLGDVRDERFVREAVTGCDVVLHLAALISIPHSYQSPASHIDTNIGGTLNVLEAARDCGVARVVHTSTSEVYGTPQTVPITEDHPLQGQSPYSASKIGADALCEAYARSFDVPVTVLRPFNTFGPRQSRRAVIPTILAQLLGGKQQIKLGSLDPQRDFTYVDDTVDGFVKMATADIAPGSLVHLGTGSSVSVRELVGLCGTVTGTEPEAVLDEQRVRPPGSEVQILLSDPRRAEELLGWRPSVSLLDGLQRTADWLTGRVDADRAETYQR